MALAFNTYQVTPSVHGGVVREPENTLPFYLARTKAFTILLDITYAFMVIL